MRPDIDLITVGTELLLGDTVDTNAAWIGRAMSAHGFRVRHHATVADDDTAIRTAVDRALDQAGVVIVTGGLGPTRDDITREAVAATLDRPLAFNAAVWQALVERSAGAGRVPSESNKVQAMVPAGAVVLANRRGSAPGLWIDTPRGVVVLLPGVPLELETLIDEVVLPRLLDRFGDGGIVSRYYRTSGIPESRLGELLAPREEEFRPLTLAYLPDQSGVDLRLTAWQLDPAEAAAALDRAEVVLRDVVGDHIYAEQRVDLAAVVLDQLRVRGQTLATAESCTGGMIGARVTAVPGSSDVYLGGVVSYANRIKIELLDVAEATIATMGAVSDPVVAAMAQGVARRLGADVAVAVSGVAGPGGGTADKPVGTVAFGWWVGGRVSTATSRLLGDREQIRIRAAHAALVGLWRRLREG